MMLADKTIQIIKSITPIVAANSETLAKRFYELMFAGNPEVKTFFNQSHQQSGSQQRALADAICAYFENIDNLEALNPVVEVLAQKHCSLQVQPEHYPIVGKYFLEAVKDVMGEAATDEIVEAVGQAYELLAGVCIRREKEIYQSQSEMEGGWVGYRKFIVDRKVPESETITSFHLVPQDGGPLPDFLPGQYVTLCIDTPTLQVAPRNYSLSDRPELGYFRVSVKKEPGQDGNPDGELSNYLHEQLEEGGLVDIGPPCGSFTLNPRSVDEQPVVFIAGGIGVTPLLSMSKTLVHHGVLAPIYFLHATRNSAEQPFVDEIQMMVSDKDHVQTRFIYSQPSAQDVELERCDYVGRINREVLSKWTPHADAGYYVCGPAEFMADMLQSLKELGVDDTRIHCGFFGPKRNLQTANLA